MHNRISYTNADKKHFMFPDIRKKRKADKNQNYTHYNSTLNKM